jgi:hypothetical protein
MTIDFAIFAVNGLFSLLFIAGLTTAFYSFVFDFMMRNGFFCTPYSLLGTPCVVLFFLDLV